MITSMLLAACEATGTAHEPALDASEQPERPDGPTADDPDAPVASPRSPYVPEGYEQVFGDEFGQANLDTTRWYTRYIYADGYLSVLNDEKQVYREDRNRLMGNDNLELAAYLHPNVDPAWPYLTYRSGMIRSKTTFRYGYFEARVRFPAGIGSWPTFWLNPDADTAGNTPRPPEIDIFEFVNNGVEDTAHMLHQGVIEREGAQGREILTHDPMFNTQWTYYTAPYAFPDDYHVISALWDTDDTVTMFIDGTETVKYHYRWITTDGQPAPNAHVLLNYAIGGQWAGRHGVDDAAFPQGSRSTTCACTSARTPGTWARPRSAWICPRRPTARESASPRTARASSRRSYFARRWRPLWTDARRMYLRPIRAEHTPDRTSA